MPLKRAWRMRRALLSAELRRTVAKVRILITQAWHLLMGGSYESIIKDGESYSPVTYIINTL